MHVVHKQDFMFSGPRNKLRRKNVIKQRASKSHACPRQGHVGSVDLVFYHRQLPVGLNFKRNFSALLETEPLVCVCACACVDLYIVHHMQILVQHRAAELDPLVSSHLSPSTWPHTCKCPRKPKSLYSVNHTNMWEELLVITGHDGMMVWCFFDPN